jgi:hypothetical protein
MLALLRFLQMKNSSGKSYDFRTGLTGVELQTARLECDYKTL